MSNSQSSSQFPRRAVLKNVQTTGQLYSSPMLVRSCSKSYMLGLSVRWTKNFQTSKLEKRQRNQRPNCQHLLDLSESKGNSRKTSISVSSTTLKPSTVWTVTNYGKLLERWEYQTILPVSWETCMQIKRQQLELSMEQLTASGLREEYSKAVCCHPVYLTYTLSTSWEMPG